MKTFCPKGVKGYEKISRLIINHGGRGSRYRGCRVLYEFYSKVNNTEFTPDSKKG